MASKRDKFSKLKKAAKDHIDETIGGKERAPEEERPADMRGFMESLARDSDEKQSPPETEAPAEGQAAPVDESETTAGEPDPAGNEDGDAGRPETPEPSGATLVEADSDAGQASEIELRRESQQTGYAEERPSRPSSSRSMPKSRDSIYNVSSDIRLEDYTEGGGGGGGSGRLGMIARIGGLIVLVLLLWWGGSALVGYLTAPTYRLAIANEYIDDANAQSFADRDPILVSSGAPVYVRFDWEEGELATDYLKIEIVRTGGGEEAVMGRRTPTTVNYIYFMGPLDPGNYELRVLDREENVLSNREFRVN